MSLKLIVRLGQTLSVMMTLGDSGTGLDAYSKYTSSVKVAVEEFNFDPRSTLRRLDRTFQET